MEHWNKITIKQYTYEKSISSFINGIHRING